MENVSQIQDNRYGISWVLPVEKSEFGNVAGPEGSGFRIFDALLGASNGSIHTQKRIQARAQRARSPPSPEVEDK